MLAAPVREIHPLRPQPVKFCEIYGRGLSGLGVAVIVKSMANASSAKGDPGAFMMVKTSGVFVVAVRVMSALVTVPFPRNVMLYAMS